MPADYNIPFPLTTKRQPTMNPHLSQPQPSPFARLREAMQGIHPPEGVAPVPLQIGEPNPEYGLVPPPSEGACYSLGLYCPNVDDVVSRALAAGATLREEPSTFISGDRYASILDPFGVRWSIMSRVEDISESESARRVAEWAAGRATS